LLALIKLTGQLSELNHEKSFLSGKNLNQDIDGRFKAQTP